MKRIISIALLGLVAGVAGAADYTPAAKIVAPRGEDFNAPEHSHTAKGVVGKDGILRLWADPIYGQRLDRAWNLAGPDINGPRSFQVVYHFGPLEAKLSTSAYTATLGGTTASQGTTAITARPTSSTHWARQGILTLTTSLGAAGRAGVHFGTATGTNSVLFGPGSRWYFSAAAQLTLTNGACTTRIGFIDNTGAASVDGAYFQYIGTSGVLGAVTANNSVRTTNTIASAGLSTNVFKRYDIAVVATNRVEFYVDGVIKAVNANNVPYGITRNTDVGIGLVKTSGTENVSALIDYVLYRCEMSQ